MLHRGVPVGIGDAQSLVRRLHVAADVDAGAAGGGAELIDHQLTDAAQVFLAGPDEETAEAGIGGETAEEIVGDGGEGVVAAQTLVERGLGLLSQRHRR